ncbi:MAG TPA: hypothetical protein VF789_31250 [Thermoanaerobaculia bacterium]
MTREEYEQRKRRLEEQFRAGVELLEVGYREQMRALELVWKARSGEGMELAIPAAPETAPPPARDEPPPRPAPAAPPKRRRGAGELREEVLEALASLPEVFDRNQVCAVLGYQPDRSSLFRILRQLTFEDVLALEKFGGGRVTTKYRKIETDSSPDDL